MKDIRKSIYMNCSVCGNDQFSTIDGNDEELQNVSMDVEVKCSDCGEMVTKEQLMEENTYKINANIEDLKKEAVKQIKKKFKKFKS